MSNGDFARQIETLKQLLDSHPNSRIRSMVHTKLDEALLWYRELLVQETLAEANAPAEAAPQGSPFPRFA